MKKESAKHEKMESKSEEKREGRDCPKEVDCMEEAKKMGAHGC